jgi:hypothetical protein
MGQAGRAPQVISEPLKLSRIYGSGSRCGADEKENCMMKMFAVAIVTIGFVSHSFATAQMAERLLCKGATNRLCTLPLEPYLKAHNLRLSEMAQPKKFMMSTACWRGYIGTWQIKDGFLWLVSVEHLDRTPVPLSRVFTNQVPPIKATWYSGTLHVTQGKMLRYVHAEFQSKFERDLYFEIEKGEVTGEKVNENRAE